MFLCLSSLTVELNHSIYRNVSSAFSLCIFRVFVVVWRSSRGRERLKHPCMPKYCTLKIFVVYLSDETSKLELTSLEMNNKRLFVGMNFLVCVMDK